MEMAYMNALPAVDTVRPGGLVSVDGRTYPLKSARLEARAEGGVAVTAFTQTYENPYSEPLEVLYTLPLPADGAVIGYTIRLGSRVIRGEVRPRQEAQEQYRKALLEGRTAALLEQNRADTFAQMLGCLPPGDTAQVEIQVLQRLAFLPAEGPVPGRWEYRFPTVVGVRYEGEPGHVPDAGRLDTDRAAEGTPVRLDASLVISDGPAGSLAPACPGREIDLEKCDGGVRVLLREQMRLDRDLVIRWSATQDAVGMRVVEGRGLPCDDGRYLLVTLTPPATVGIGIPRDLTLLVDASGSMSGNPFARAKIVVQELLRSLDPGDRFEILVFASDVRRLVSQPLAATPENIRQALEALERVRAGGCTEMTRALIEALTPLRPESQRQVVLLSDGYIGFEAEVIGEVLRRLGRGARLHTVGIGSAPNRTLTRGCARAGRGIEVLVGDDDDARAACRRLLQATVRPVLTDLTVSGAVLAGLAPKHPQDVLQGQPLILLAEIAGGGGRLVITGQQAGLHGVWERRLEIPAVEGPAPLARTALPIGALFGREAIEDMELQVSAGDKNRALDLEVERLGMRHGIASRRTSLIAVSEDPTVDPRDPRRRQCLPVEVPAEVSAEGAGLRPLMRGSSTILATAMYSPAVSEATCQEIEAAPYRAYRRGLVDTLRASVFPGTPAIEARVLRVDGDMLVIEVDVPRAGFRLPRDGTRVRVRFSDDSTAEAAVDGKVSSPAGPHQQGLTVRLALKLRKQLWTGHGSAILSWRETFRSGINEIRVQIGRSLPQEE
jgi:Ca-activated chloride channel family protein